MDRSAVLAPAAILAAALFMPVLGQNISPGRQQHATATPIRHLVIIFPENISFDHYFGMYPRAENPPNEPKFVAAPNTPAVNGLSSALLTRNPNAANPENGQGAVNPFRLDRSQAATADQEHAYTA
ncbi:MAG: alkaline phosphatase family protein, partial [Bryobacteraceae bacterium]